MGLGEEGWARRGARVHDSARLRAAALEVKSDASGLIHMDARMHEQLECIATVRLRSCLALVSMNAFGCELEFRRILVRPQTPPPRSVPPRLGDSAPNKCPLEKVPGDCVFWGWASAILECCAILVRHLLPIKGRNRHCSRGIAAPTRTG